MSSLPPERMVSLYIPKDTTYVVTEAAGKYTASYLIVDRNRQNKINNTTGQNNEEFKELSTRTETADAGEDVEITFTNEKMITQKLILEKKLLNTLGNNTDEFSFGLTIRGLKEKSKIGGSFGPLVADSDGVVFIEFTRPQNSPVEFTDIPVGATYEITEGKSDYVASYVINNCDEENNIEGANDVPDKALSTKAHTIAEGKDPEVVFTNREIAADITITKKIDMTYGTVPERQYKTVPFNYEVTLKGLEASKRAYNQIEVEYSSRYSNAVVKKTLAAVMEMDAVQANSPATNAIFTITLHHGEAFKILHLPYQATCLVKEQASLPYFASYEVTGNEGSILQATARSNTEINKDLVMDQAEMIDVNDTDLVIAFTNQYEFQPYELPAAGTADQRMVIVFLTIGFVATSATYLTLNRRRRRKHHS